jgi:transposase InsO family protein
MITYHALQKIPNYRYLPIKSNFNTMSGPGEIIGLAHLNVKIMDVEKKIVLAVTDSPLFKYDIILGTDYITSFRLNCDSNLIISQTPEKSINVTFHSPIWNDYMTKELFNEKVKHLPAPKRATIFDFLQNNVEAFATNKFDVGNVTTYECPINLSSNAYVAFKPYRCTYADQQEIDKQCNELLSRGMISQSTSAYASPVTLQYKKDGLGASKSKTRLCVDYRSLNKLIIPESQPFPLIDEIVAKTRGCFWFSAFDINAAFHSIPVKESDRYKTAFITQSGHFEWNFMPFGVKVAPSVFQRVLSSIIHKYGLADFVVNYLDDLLVFSKTFEEHMTHVQRLIDAIFAEGFRLNFKKCSFASSRIQYLGHILSPNSVEPLSDNIAAITNFPVPSSRRTIRQFLGKINFYRKFIPNSSSLLEPFHNLLRKNTPFSWTHDCQTAFNSVKALLTSSPILAIFDRNLPISIYTDASGIGIGAVLKQKQADGLEKPVAYFSRKLTEGQMRKKAIYIESLAIREAIRYWRFWLIGRRFTVITDHKPLEHMNLKARSDEELGDLALELSQFDFDVIYRPGKDNCEADCLSRNPVNEPLPDPDVSNPIIPSSVHFLSFEDVKYFQENITPTNVDVKINDVIFRVINGKRLVVLDELTSKELISRIHTHYGHIGPKHMFAILRNSFYIPCITKLVLEYCKKCITCIKNKSRRPRIQSRLGLLGPATKPFEIMSLDTIGGFSHRSSPFRYIQLLVDHFSRHAWISCTKGQTASEMISLIDSVQQFNQIGTLLTDQYGGLSSDEFASYIEKSNINHIFTAVDSPFSNGTNERLNQTLVCKIRCQKNDPSSPPRQNWGTIAKQCVAQYNSVPHSVTTFSPSYLLTGVPSSPLPPDLLTDSTSYESDKALALERTVRRHNYNKKRCDKNRLDISFSVGDSVYVSTGNKLNRKKLDELRSGPHTITRKISNNVFELFVGSGPFPHRLYHASKLIASPT